MRRIKGERSKAHCQVDASRAIPLRRCPCFARVGRLELLGPCTATAGMISAQVVDRMAKWLLLSVLLIAALGAAAWFLDPTYSVRGWLAGESFFHGRPASYWRHALLDPAPAARTNTIKTLADGGLAAVPVLLELLRSDSSEVRWTAADALGQIGPDAAGAAEALGAALKDDDPLVRRVAAEALGKIGPDARAAVPALIDMLNTEDRLHAVKALIRFRAAARDAASALIAVLKDPSAEVRWNACEALGDMRADAAVPALQELLADPEDKVREHAAEALGEIGPGARPALPALRRLLDDPDADVRDEAIKAIKRIDPQASLPPTKKKSD